MAEETDLDSLIRRVDPDRWLSSRFVGDPAARADLIALYAFNHELARAAEVASQPLIGEMRLAWWREAIDEMAEGRRVRRHPVAQALAGAARRRGLSREALEGLVDARLRDLDGWPLKAEETMGYVDATAGGLMAAAARTLSPRSDPKSVVCAARAWGLAGLARLGRLPIEWSAQEVRARVSEALNRGRIELRGSPVAAFPAVAHATLSRAYAEGRAPSELGKRLRLLAAVARARV